MDDNTTPPNFNMQEVDYMSTAPGPLGLKLTKSESFLALLERRLSAAAADDITTPNDDPPRLSSDNVGSQSQSQSHHHQAIPRKPKPAYFPMNSISIGPYWQRVFSRQRPMKAKFYLGRRKLVWELVEGELKFKIVMACSDITAINALLPYNEPGTLQIELGKAPLFFRKIKGKPNINWEPTSDPTNGHALFYRRYTATFPPGRLDRHYLNLLENDERLFELSQKPFPTQGELPYFNRAFHTGVEFVCQ